MIVKYCGITKEEEIQHLQQLPIDYVGFVFYKKSKRYVDKEQARRLRAKLKPSIPAVGVFVEEEIPKICTKIYRTARNVATGDESGMFFFGVSFSLSLFGISLYFYKRRGKDLSSE